MTEYWLLKIEPKAEKQLAKLDWQVAKGVQAALNDLVRLENPASRCKQLRGSHAGLHSFRIRDLRVILELLIEDRTISVVSVGWRKDVYG